MSGYRPEYDVKLFISPSIPTQPMYCPSFDNEIPADAWDVMADFVEEEREAMRNTDYWQWDGVEEISSEERNACDHYNERYTYPSGY